MLNIVLVSPEIHQNTGNIARTCAATGAALHLIRPLGFEITDKALRRAGLDYWYLLDVQIYDSLEDFFARNGQVPMWLYTTKAPGATAMSAITMAIICFLAGNPPDCRSRFWKPIGTAA